MGKSNLALAPQPDDHDDEEQKNSETKKSDDKKGGWSFGLVDSVKAKATDAAKGLFDVCFDTIEEKSNEVINTYKEKTQELTSELIHNEKEFLNHLDARAQILVKDIFKNIEISLDLFMARILSLLTTVTLLYVAMQINEAVKTESFGPFKIALTFWLGTVVVGSSLRLIRYIWDWHRTLKEYQRWQFVTGLIGAAAMLAILGLSVVNYALIYFGWIPG